MLVFNCIHGNAPRYLSDSIDMASHMHDRNTRLNMSSDVNVYRLYFDKVYQTVYRLHNLQRSRGAP